MRNLLLACTLLFSVTAHSQYETQKLDGFGVYFKAGANFANVVNWDDNEPTDMYVGASGGMGLWFKLGKSKRKMGALSIEGLFAGQGFKMEQAGNEWTARTTYFNIPVIYRQYFGHMYIAAGAQYGILMGVKEIVNGTEKDVPEGIYEKGTWSGLVGLGVNFGGKTTRQVDFGFEATYAHGLSKMRSDFSKARHSVINVSMFIPVAVIADIAAAMSSGQ